MMDTTQIIEYRNKLLNLVPPSGENIGNVSLREGLQRSIETSGGNLTDEEYWLLRDQLIDEGVLEQGRGRGGSVHRVIAVESPAPGVPDNEADAVEVAIPEEVSGKVEAMKTEVGLYVPFHGAIISGYTKDNRIKRFISEITAQQGRRVTGGKWTRPDMTLVAVRTYQFSTPGKRIEVITFEVKPDLDSALEGVYEALAHSAFAHRSYLAVDVREFKDKSEIPDERIQQECTRHGVGYMTFTDVADYASYEIMCSARLVEPDPYDVDNFVRTQISPAKQEELREFLQ